MINTAVRLRPDPLIVSGGGASATGATSPPIRHAVHVIGAAPRARLALDVDGDLAGGDGRRDDDDPGAHEAARPRDDEPVRHLRPHRRDVRLQPAGRALRRPARLARRRAGRGGDPPGVDAAGLGGGDLRVAAVPGAVGARAGLELRPARRVGAADRVGRRGRAGRRAGNRRPDDEPVRRRRRVLVGVHPPRRRLPRPRRHRRRRRPRPARPRLRVLASSCAAGPHGARQSRRSPASGWTDASDGVLPSPRSD